MVSEYGANAGVSGSLSVSGSVTFKGESDVNVDSNTLFVDASTNRVGVGTDAPDYTLDVAGDIGVDQKIHHNGDADTYINFTDNRIRFDAGGLNLFGMHKKSSAPHQVTVNNGGNNVDFVINDNNSDVYFRADASTGRIGIGTDSPETELHISATDGRVRTEATAGNHAGYEWAVAGTRKWIVYNDPDSSDNLEFKTDSNVRMSIEQDGNVGIGTQSPATELHINGALTLSEKSSDPSNPSEGQSVLWMSDGTGTGDDGDILMKITAGGVTKTVTLVDFSAS